MPTRHRSSGSTWTLLQTITPVQGASPQTITFTTQNCTPGSIIFVGVGNSPVGAATVTVSDPTNGSYAAVSGGTSNNSNLTAQVFYVANTASTKLTITVTSTVTSSNHVGVMVAEFSGGSTTVDAVAPITSFTSTDTPTTPSLSASTNDLLIAMFVYTGSGSISYGAGWSDIGLTNGGDGFLTQYKINVSSGSYTSTCGTTGTTTSYVGTLVAFKA